MMDLPKARAAHSGLVAAVALAAVVGGGCGDDEGGGGGPVGAPPTFTEFPGLSLTGVWVCSLAWGDCDNDGDLDLAVAGQSSSAIIATVYENDGAGGFSEFPGLSLTGVNDCSLAWGDCDNDGDLDLAVAGQSSRAIITTVYESDGAGGFSEFPSLGLTGVYGCSLAWGDCDNDGDLDLAVAGRPTSASITTVYENDGPLPNVPPDAPTGLAADSFPGVTVLYWDEALDLETPTEGLSYNLWIGKPGQGSANFPSMAASDGLRRLRTSGPIIWNPSYPWAVIRDLQTGLYEFRVQAIDSGFEGGAWSEPCLFAVP
ncbi:MAG: FG-GAP repeat domain-containing protein [Planctomycetota bacterium]|jgi:hypothetical protein